MSQREYDQIASEGNLFPFGFDEDEESFFNQPHEQGTQTICVEDLITHLEEHPYQDAMDAYFDDR